MKNSKTRIKKKESKELKTSKETKPKPDIKKLAPKLESKKSLQKKPALKASTEKFSQPQTMADLLAKTGYRLKGLKKGQKVEGIITDIGKRKLLVDIGAKTEGIVLEKEYEASKDFIGNLKVGDTIQVIVGMPENEKGQILLSLRQAADNYKWGLLEEHLKTGGELEVRGLDINKGGMIARVMDVYGFIPVSQFGRQWLGNLDKLYNKIFKVKVIEIDREKNRLIFSEKAISEAKAIAAQDEALKKVKLGDKLIGIVSGIMPFGIFVRVSIDSKEVKKVPKIKDKKEETKEDREAEPEKADKNSDLFLEGLVHISEISWEKVEDLNKIYKVGDKVEVRVLGIDKASSRLNLSIKQLKDDPWTKIAGKYQKEKKFTGTVTKLAAFGAFISLEEGLEGLIHISKIPADFEIKVGDKVKVYIENVDLEHHRIALGLVLAKKPVGYK